MTQPALERLVDYLTSRVLDHPLRVGVDGVCGAGKTTFARQLVAALRASARRPVIYVNSDGFHHVQERRYRQGRMSARGYYDDAYDFDALADLVLRPLGPDGSLRYATAVHDLETDAVIADAHAVAPPDAIAVFDCTFIQRDGLRDLWDEVIYLDVAQSVATDRAVLRDAEAFGGRQEALQAHQERYQAACGFYLAEQAPAVRASILIDNTDVEHPVLLRLG